MFRVAQIAYTPIKRYRVSRRIPRPGGDQHQVIAGRPPSPGPSRARWLAPRRLGLHDLRHTCATILLMAGQHPKFVQEMFRHANVSITLDTYSHLIKGMDDGLADAMDDAL
ncbi:MAG TPA: tyrosine-type recombinase/integrase [Rubrobacteraceae bacterium]|nr:tyrosine-type recombinase/integrase [Rubrobacteraceae bacterium]